VTDTLSLPSQVGPDDRGERYKWTVLSNTTLGVFMATIDSSILLIALPDIFRGIGINPLKPGNTSYLLWLILSFLIVSSVLVVSLGRLGDMYGRVKMYNLGFAVYTFFSLLLTITWMSGSAAALYLIIMRVFQGVGAAFLIANSGALLTDAFPEHQRGMALGINQVSALSGSFIGLVLGGILGPIQWRLIFLVSVPVGLFATIWAYRSLREVPVQRHGGIDWPGNITFALGLISVMVGITYGIQPYGGHTMGWTSPFVLGCLVSGVALLIAFGIIETLVPDPMFRLDLFRIRAFTAGCISTLLAAIGRGGLMFILIIWLQGIWLPLHGYDFARTPLWAGIYMLPLTVGFLIAGPISGFLSDRFGSRPFATGGMLAAAATFGLLELLPVNFPYPAFAALLLCNGLAMGAFAAPNRAGVMNSLPRQHRGVGAGMNSTFQNSAQVLSIGVFFTLMIIGLSSTLPGALYHGLTTHGVPKAAALKAANLPPVTSLFSAFLGFSPVQHLLGTPVLSHLSQANQAVLNGRGFFPSLISKPFRDGLHAAFDFAVVACLIAAGASWLRGGKYVYSEKTGTEMTPAEAPDEGDREVAFDPATVVS
jgi:MFS family permease